MAPTTAFNTNSNGSQTANTMIQRLWKQNRATRASTGGPSKFNRRPEGRRRLPQPAKLLAVVEPGSVTFDSAVRGRARRVGRSDQRWLRLNLGRRHVVTFHMNARQDPIQPLGDP